jgi:hypothetical protein
MVCLTLFYVVINPILFSEIDSKDAWISRSVLGEQLWLEDGHVPPRRVTLCGQVQPSIRIGHESD